MKKVIAILRILSFLALLACAISAPAQRAAKPDPLAEHIPMLQTSTSDTEAGFTLLGRRLVDFKLKAVPVSGKGPAIESELLGGPIQDPDGVLHDRVLKFRMKGLAPNTQYKLQILEVSKYGETLSDEREFKTFDSVSRPLSYAVVSCMSDERKYAVPRKTLWAKLVDSKPDFVALIGDQTYVDSFETVKRGTATPLDVWIRYFDSFKTNTFFQSYNLIPTINGWDDHDTGIDNGNMHTPVISEARRAFQALYGNHDIPGVLENGKEGVYRIFHLAGQHFVFMDNRSFRDEDTKDSRYGHYGQAQEEWFFAEMAKIKDGPVTIFDGGMWGAETVLAHDPHGGEKRLTESFFGDHPTQYNAFMKRLNATSLNYVLVSGDIHMSQVIQHGPQFKGSARYAPFSTIEITSSPIHSIIFKPKPGEAQWWPDKQRLVAAKDYNYVQVTSQWDGHVLDISTASVGMGAKANFSYGTTISRDQKYFSARRRFLRGGFDRTDKKVRVAFFDADDTLRTAPSKSVSASSPDDVMILPGVADKIAQLNREGYLVAIVSNQGGVQAGKVSFETADRALRTTIRKIQEQNPEAKIHYYDFSERGAQDYFSKPSPGMGKQLEQALLRRGYEIDRMGSFMIGDAQYTKQQITPAGTAGTDFSDGDRQFAIEMGLPTYHPKDYFGWTPGQAKAILEKNVDALVLAGNKCEALF